MNKTVHPAQTKHHSYARCGYTAIALVFGAFGIWAALAPLDRAAIASGQVSVETDHKVVQHLEGGIIREGGRRPVSFAADAGAGQYRSVAQAGRCRPRPGGALPRRAQRRHVDCVSRCVAGPSVRPRNRHRDNPIRSANLRRAAGRLKTRSAS